MAEYVVSGQVTLADLNDAVALPVPPSNPREGSMWFNTEDNKFYIYINGSWKFAAEGMKIGGKNLIRDSRNSFSKNEYKLKEYTLSEDLLEGEEYTFLIKGTVPSGQKFAIYMNDGGNPVGFADKEYTEDVYYCTFTAVAPINGWERKITLYNYPQSSTTAHVEWVALYKGNTPQDWTSAPEDTEQEISNINLSLSDFAADNKITRFERATIRQAVFDITGVHLSPSDSMPSLATIDNPNYNKGSLFSIRKTARNIGVNIGSGTRYEQLGVAYTNLAAYLNGLSPKPWDTSSTATIEVDPNQWDTLWKDYYTYYQLLQVDIQDRQKLLSETAEQNAIAAVSNAISKAQVTISNPVMIQAPIATLGLPEFQGRHLDRFNGQNPPTDWAKSGNRIVPITNPTFSAGTDFTIFVKLYGDGTYNDKLKWDNKGQAVKTKMWEDILLDDKQNWSFHADASGYKQVKATGFSTGAIADNTVMGVKYNGQLLTRVSSISGVNQVSLTNASNTLFLSLADSDTGWGETYTPTPEEIKAYFLGWKMCNGNYNVPYNGSGVKQWYPIGDTDLSRATKIENGAPTTRSQTLIDEEINSYQILFRMTDLFQEVIDFNGVLALTQGENVVTITYPENTPEITSGIIKYATNLGTVQQDISYIIPTIQKRIANAEEKITDESIVNTVTNSIEYQTALATKANASALGDYATRDELENLSNDIDNKLGEALSQIDLEPYVTRSELEQTASNITARFSATGGMNIVKNSIGFAGLDFWQNYTSYPVNTVTDNVLESLGFGSGFHFIADGRNKGIVQTVKTTPYQPYTLSWYLNKMTSGQDNSYRFFIQILENGAVTQQIADNSKIVTSGYAHEYMTYTPTTDSVTLRFIGYGNVEAILTGIMMNVGEVPLMWTLSTGEAYNTYVRMNLNGIRVSQLDAERKEVGYTLMSPQEFAGYYDTDGNGTMDKVFYLNKNETVTEKLRSKTEINMGTIKVINLTSPQYTGWAFVPALEEEE